MHRSFENNILSILTLDIVKLLVYGTNSGMNFKNAH